VACQQPPRASGGANEVGPFWIRLPSRLGSGAGLVGGALAAGGRACQRPSGQIPPPWAWWENEAPATRAACGPSQAIGLVGLTVRLLLGEPALGAPGIVLGFLQNVRDERIAKFLLRELIL
jgi:hypothetical protein